MLLLALGCSFTTFEHVPCTNTSACRDAFGFGYACGASSLCEPIVPPDRCTDTYPDDLLTNPSAYRDAIVFGSLFDHDPDAGDLAEVRAVQLAIKQVNETEGLEGRSYGIIHCSYEDDYNGDGLDYETSLDVVAPWLADQAGVSVALGPATSGQSEAAYALLGPRDVLLISPSATSPSLTDLDGINKSDAEPGLLWRTAPPDTVQGERIAQDMADRLITKAAVVYQTSSYGQGLAQQFKVDFEALGGAVSLFSFDEGVEPAEAIASAGNEAGIEEVLFISSELSDVISFLNAAGSLEDYADRSIFLTDAARDDGLFDGLTAQGTTTLDRVRGSSPASPSGDVYDFFDAAYSVEFGVDPSTSVYTAYAYDASWLALYGSAWAWYQEGALSGSGMARGLRRVSAGSDVQIIPSNWGTVKSYFKESSPVDLEGASGQLDYDPDTEETSGPVDIWIIDGRAFANVE